MCYILTSKSPSIKLNSVQFPLLPDNFDFISTIEHIFARGEPTQITVSVTLHRTCLTGWYMGPIVTKCQSRQALRMCPSIRRHNAI